MNHSNSLRALLLETRAIYRHADAAYARFSCPSTAECCQLAARARQPWLWPSEWELLQAFAKQEWGSLPPLRADGACPFLDATGKRCRVYEVRPLGCRTFFCDKRQGPKHEPIEAMVELSRRLEFINQQREPEVSGPSELMSWYTDALNPA